MAGYVPPGWPAGVHPPDSEEFEQTAVTWLLDVVPPDYRLHGVLRRHPLALAVLARHHLAACVQGARDGYRSARTELASLPPGGVDAVLEVYRAEGRRLVETARSVDLVGRALRGEVFTPRLAGERRSARQQQPARAKEAAPKDAPPKYSAPKEDMTKERTLKEGAPNGRTPKEGVLDEGIAKERTLKEGAPNGRTPKGGVPKGGVLDEGIANEGTPKERTPKGGVPNEGATKEGAPGRGARRGAARG